MHTMPTLGLVPRGHGHVDGGEFPRDIKVMLKLQSVLWGQTERIIILLKLPIYYAMKTSTRGHRWASIWTTLLLHIKGL